MEYTGIYRPRPVGPAPNRVYIPVGLPSSPRPAGRAPNNDNPHHYQVNNGRPSQDSPSTPHQSSPADLTPDEVYSYYSHGNNSQTSPDPSDTSSRRRPRPRPLVAVPNGINTHPSQSIQDGSSSSHGDMYPRPRPAYANNNAPRPKPAEQVSNEAHGCPFQREDNSPAPSSSTVPPQPPYTQTGSNSPSPSSATMPLLRPYQFQGGSGSPCPTSATTSPRPSPFQSSNNSPSPNSSTTLPWLRQREQIPNIPFAHQFDGDERPTLSRQSTLAELPGDFPDFEMKKIETNKPLMFEPKPPRVEVKPLKTEAEPKPAEATPPPNDKPSHSKSVVRGTSARLWDTWIHVVPMGLSGFLMYINIQRWYWFEEEPIEFHHNGVKNSLQFGAKLYELLVIASLGTLTLKLLKRRLVQSEVPLGLLTGAYRIGDIPYIFSTPFWKALPACLPLALFIVMNTIIVTLAGPSSAILMVPELDWYPLPNAFSNVESPFYYWHSRATLWPRQLTKAEIGLYDELPNCDGIGEFTSWCPAGGFAELQGWVQSYGSSYLTNHPTFRSQNGNLGRQLASVESIGDVTTDGAVAMTTVSHSILLTISGLLDFIDEKEVETRVDRERANIGSIVGTKKFKMTTKDNFPIFQPLVQTSCAWMSQDMLDLKTEPFFGDSSLNCLGDAMCESMMENRQVSIKDMSKVLPAAKKHYYHFFQPNTTDDDPTPLFTMIQLPVQEENNEISLMSLICTTIAHWVPAKLTISPGVSELVESNVTNELGGLYKDQNTPIKTGTAIKMDMSWVEYLRPPMTTVFSDGGTYKTSPLEHLLVAMLIPFQPEGTNETTYVFAPARFRPDDDKETVVATFMRARTAVEKVICSVVAEGLARLASGSASVVVRKHNETAVVLTDLNRRPAVSDIVVEWSSSKEAVVSNGWGMATKVATDMAPSADSFMRLLPDKSLGMTGIDFDVERFGHGSGKRSDSMTFALIVVLVYMLIVISYFVYNVLILRLLLRKPVPTVAAWDDVVDMLVLAWNSPASARGWISDRSFGVTSSKAWVLPVSVRAEKGGRVKLVTNEGGGEVLRRGKLYC